MGLLKHSGEINSYGINWYEVYYGVVKTGDRR